MHSRIIHARVADLRFRLLRDIILKAAHQRYDGIAQRRAMRVRALDRLDVVIVVPVRDGVMAAVVVVMAVAPAVAMAVAMAVIVVVVIVAIVVMVVPRLVPMPARPAMAVSVLLRRLHRRPPLRAEILRLVVEADLLLLALRRASTPLRMVRMVRALRAMAVAARPRVRERVWGRTRRAAAVRSRSVRLVVVVRMRLRLEGRAVGGAVREGRGLVGFRHRERCGRR